MTRSHLFSPRRGTLPQLEKRPTKVVPQQQPLDHPSRMPRSLLRLISRRLARAPAQTAIKIESETSIKCREEQVRRTARAVDRHASHGPTRPTNREKAKKVRPQPRPLQYELKSCANASLESQLQTTQGGTRDSAPEQGKREPGEC